MTYPTEMRRRVLDLASRQQSDAAIARATGVSRSTIRSWRMDPAAALRRAARCPRCDDVPLSDVDYAYVLGLYLGDGTLSPFPRDVWRLRIVQDQRYPHLAEEGAASLRVLLPNKVQFQLRDGCIEYGSYSKHWPCLLPQHGAGPKHQRPIRLASWQSAIVHREPAALLRGLIHSDGCRSINRVRRAGRLYEYPRYWFTNRSDDIRTLFVEACELLGLTCRRTNPVSVAVSLREDVEVLDRLIGPK